VDEPRRKAVIEALRKQRCRIEPYPKDKGIVLSALVPVDLPEGLPAVEQEEDEAEGDEASFTAREVSLEEHLRSVGERARKFAEACGLPQKFVKTVELAGNWHDQGKRDWRFQAWLRGSELEALAEEGCPLAKSGRDPSWWQPSAVYGYPRGARHEFVSVRLFEQVQNKITSGAIPELAKFLIGTHHGFGRPFVPVVRETHPVDIRLRWDGADIKVASDHRLHLLGSGWTDLFWQLVRRFGWWGLAYLEALLITADRSVSAQGG
jgi:CRISPR-associated endonuclease/helicase Cas3